MAFRCKPTEDRRLLTSCFPFPSATPCTPQKVPLQLPLHCSYWLVARLMYTVMSCYTVEELADACHYHI